MPQKRPLLLRQVPQKRPLSAEASAAEETAAAEGSAAEETAAAEASAAEETVVAEASAAEEAAVAEVSVSEEAAVAEVGGSGEVAVSEASVSEGAGTEQASTVADSGPGEPVAAAEQSSVEKSAGTDSGPETAEVATEAQPSQNEASGDVVGNSASAQSVENNATVAEAQPVQNEASGDVDGNSASAQSVENSATVAEAQSVQSEASSDVAGNSASAQSVENNATVAEAQPSQNEASGDVVGNSASAQSVENNATVAEAQPVQNEASGDVVGNSASAQPVENSATVAEAQSVQSEASSDVAGASASAQSGTNNATTAGSTATAAEASTGNSQSSAVDASVSSTPSSQTSGPQNDPGLPAESNATGTGDASVIAPVAQPVVPVPTQVTEVILPDNPPEALPDELVVVSTDQINITELLLSNDFDPDGGQPTIVSVSSERIGAVTLIGDQAQFQPSQATLLSLAAGATSTETISYTIQTGNLTATANLVVSYEGVNDVAEFALSLAEDTDNALFEDSDDFTVRGTVVITDPDTGEGALVSSTASYGTVSVEGEDWTYTLERDSAAVNALAAGERLTDTITFTSDDGTTQTQTVVINGANDPSVISGSSTTLAFIEGDAAAIINSSVSVSDVDGSNIEGATVSITGGYIIGEDVLAFEDANGITGVFDVETGVLTLKGSASTAAYEAALESVTYQNVNDSFPNPGDRTVSFVTNDGVADSAAVTSIVNVSPVNDVPEFTGSGGPLGFVEGSAPKVINDSLSLVDVDGSNIEGATVSITGGYIIGEDVLAFEDANGITGVFDVETGVLTLKGSASTAAYEAALESVTYQNVNDSFPNPGDRTVSFVTNDGVADSAAVTSIVNVSPVNDVPEFTGSGGPLGFVEGSAPKVINDSLSLVDVDGSNIEGATVSITGGYIIGEDVLAFEDANGITGVFDVETGVLTLKGSASTAAYEAALESVTYQNVNDSFPNPGDRTVSFVTNDGVADSAAVTSIVNVSPVNDVPEFTGSGGPLGFVEGSAPKVINDSLSLVDVDGSNIEGATVSITGGYIIGEDVLAFEDANGITGVFDVETGVLTLKGSASTAAYEAALESVTYQNVNDSFPNPGDRTVSFVTNDGVADSAAVTSIVNVSPVNDVPEFTGSGGPLGFVEGSAPKVINDSLSLVDVDGSNIEGATVSITGGYIIGEDVLAFEDANGITGVFDVETGVLTLKGSASTAAYEAALESVTYQNVNDSFPNPGDRTVSFVTNDGVADSAAVTSIVNVSPVNDVPEFTGSGGPLGFVEGSAPKVINDSLSLVDVDGSNIEGATVSITGGYIIGEDVLAFEDANGITGVFDVETGVLTLKGSASTAAYEAALESVTYQNVNDSFPNPGDRTVSFVTNDGVADSAAVTSIVNVSPVNDVPEFTGSGGPLGFVEGSAPKVINDSLSLVDVDGSNIEGATVSITGGYIIGEDVLAFEDANGITGVFDVETGVLTLKGSASTAAYEAALESVTYQNVNDSSPNPGDRTVSFVTNDGVADSAAVTSIVNVSPVNDVPEFTGSGGPLGFVEGSAPKVINDSLSLVDVDGSNIEGATVSITGGYIIGEDVLAFEDANGITGVFDVETGVLTLKGSASTAAYEAALESVTYQNVNDSFPNPGDRTVSFVTNDGVADSAAVTSIVNVSPVNDVPEFTGSGGPLGFVEGSAPKVINDSLSLVDVDGSNIEGATVSITGGYIIGEDVLAFEDANGITGVFDVETGVLTLKGSASTAAYEAALESVTYQNVNDSFPNPGDRTVSFVTNDGVADSAAVTSIVNVSPVNDVPEFTGSGGPLGFVEGSAPKVINDSLSLVDVDGSNIEGATVSITGGYIIGEDVLAFEDANGITGVFDVETGVLTLKGSASTAAYEAALESVTYQNVNDSFPNPGDRTVSFVTNDGVADSAAVTSIVNVSPVNDVPEFTGSGGPLGFVEGSAPKVINDSLSLVDVDGSNIEGATVSITGGYIIGEDVLAFEDANGITGVFDVETGVLTLKGSASTAAYEAALESVTYQNVNDSFPNPGDRTVSFVTNDGVADSAAVTSIVNVSPVNDVPEFTGSGGPLGFVEGSAPKVINDSLSLVDVDGSNIEGATVSITGGYIIGEDVLAFEDANGITGVFDVETGVLTLKGSASTAAYEAALESVTYQNVNDSSPNPGDRTVSFVTNDGVADSAAVTSVIGINYVPTLSGIDSILIFTEGGAAQIIDSSIIVLDTNDANIQSATITISDGYVAGEDVLAFTNANGIIGAWNSSAGTLTLSGSATKAAYATALETVTFQNINTDDPNNGDRKVLWSVNDGGVGSIPATTTISVINVNDAPVVTGAGGTLPFVEDGTAVVIDSSLSLSDDDNANIAGATIAISDGYIQSEDVLAFTNANGITGVWDAESGKLTLSGAATIAVYEAALESVTYQNLNGAGPNPLTRTVSWIIEDGTSPSSAVTSFIGVNSAPSITGVGGTLAFTEGAPAKIVDDSISVLDTNDINLQGATITISSGYVLGEDVLAFSNANGITGSWNSGVGVLTLSGSATKAVYEAALETVTYQNTNSDNPNNSSRTITWTIKDGTVNSSPVTSAVNLTAINDAPVFNTGAGSTVTNYEPGSGTLIIDSSLNVGDVDNANIQSATVKIGYADYVVGEDVLAFNDANGITGEWSVSEGILRLSGPATIAVYEAALESITYTNSADPFESASFGSRTLTWQINDGTTDSSPFNSILRINYAPTLSGVEGTVTFTEGDNTQGAPQIVDSSISVLDTNDAKLQSATVTISSGYVVGEDLLEFPNSVNSSGVTGNWDASTGVLTFTAGSNPSKAVFEAALATVTYRNINNDDPNTSNRTITFVINDGWADSNAPTVTVTVNGFNDAPDVSGAVSGTPIYTEGDAAISNTGFGVDLTITDVDDSNIESGTLSFSSGYVAGEDVLAFTDANGITGSWNSETGVLTLTGSATKAAYASAFENATYQNTNSDNPNTNSRVLVAVVNDGTANSNGAATLLIIVNAVNDAPVIVGAGGTLSFTEDGAAAIVDNNLSLSDVDDTNIEGATITISSGYVPSEDLLAFASANGITGFWDSSSGTLFLSGNATTAAYEAALESVTYQNINNADPSTAARTVSWIINDGAANSSAVATSLVVTAINDAPVLSGSGSTTAYIEGDSATVIDSSLSLSDVDSANIVGATVAITGGFVSGQDQLAFANANGITGVWNSSTGVLTLSGSASRAHYEAALESVTYSNVGSPASLGTRTVTWQVNDGESVSTAVISTISVASQAASGFGVPSLSKFNSAGMDQPPSGQSLGQDPGFDAAQGVLTETDALPHFRDSMDLDDVGAQNNAAPGLGAVMGELLSTDYIDFSESRASSSVDDAVGWRHEGYADTALGHPKLAAFGVGAMDQDMLSLDQAFDGLIDAGNIGVSSMPELNVGLNSHQAQSSRLYEEPIRSDENSDQLDATYIDAVTAQPIPGVREARDSVGLHDIFENRSLESLVDGLHTAPDSMVGHQIIAGVFVSEAESPPASGNTRSLLDLHLHDDPLNSTGF